MEEKIFTLAEAAKKTGIREDLLETWVNKGLLSPAVRADGNNSFFNQEDMVIIAHLLNLSNLGYEIEDLLKIAKKVGLPNKAQRKKSASGNYLTIGELTEKTGLNARTLKHWEEKGILLPTSRSGGGYRLYNPDCVETCNLIHDLQLFNYSLEEIREMSALLKDDDGYDQPERSDDDELKEIETELGKIANLFERMTDIDKGITRWKKRLKKRRSACLSKKKTLLKEKKEPNASQAKEPLKKGVEDGT